MIVESPLLVRRKPATHVLIHELVFAQLEVLEVVAVAQQPFLYLLLPLLCQFAQEVLLNHGIIIKVHLLCPYDPYHCPYCPYQTLCTVMIKD